MRDLTKLWGNKTPKTAQNILATRLKNMSLWPLDDCIVCNANRQPKPFIAWCVKDTVQVKGSSYTICALSSWFQKERQEKTTLHESFKPTKYVFLSACLNYKLEQNTPPSSKYIHFFILDSWELLEKTRTSSFIFALRIILMSLE